MTVCKHCLCAKLRFAKRRSYERLLGLFLIRPYRCTHCSARFLRFSLWHRQGDDKPSSSLQTPQPVNKDKAMQRFR
jgi:hypothetical protein